MNDNVDFFPGLGAATDAGWKWRVIPDLTSIHIYGVLEDETKVQHLWIHGIHHAVWEIARKLPDFGRDMVEEGTCEGKGAVAGAFKALEAAAAKLEAEMAK